MKIIDRYLLSEVLRPFLLFVAGVIVIMLSVRLSQDIELIVVHKIPIPIVAKMILYKIPEFVVLGLPIAYLCGIMLGLARMSKDSEIIAVRSSGTSGMRLLVPILMVSLMICGACFALNEEIVPRANQRSERAKEAIATMQAGPEGTIETNLTFKGVDTRFYSLKSVNRSKKMLNGILIYDTHTEHPYKIISARQGRWEGTVWHLEDGIVQEYAKDSFGRFVSKEYTFKNLKVNTRLKLEHYVSGEIKAKEMSAVQLKDVIAATKAGGQETRPYEVEYESKFASPMATFFAALIAAPIALRFARGGYIGFAISIILIFFFFVSRDIANAAGINGFLEPRLAAWSPNILFGVVGLFFLFQVD